MPEERKLVSVLFADTVGSTALGAEHDPELVRATMARYFDGSLQLLARGDNLHDGDYVLWVKP